MTAPATTPSLPLIAIGGSAGAFEPLLEVLRGLDGERAAAIFVVLHIPAQGGRALANVLNRSTLLPAEYAMAGERIVPGRVYIAPPDRHLSVDADRVHVHRSPRENHCRPAIDPLLRSAAQHHGPRVIGVLLSGALADGTAGLLAVKRRGGLTVVQDPAEAMHPSMPRSALASVAVDQVLPALSIAPFLRASLAARRQHPPVFDPPVGDEMALPHAEHEDALWAGLRSLRERVALTQRMAERATSSGRVNSAAILAQRIAVLERHATTLEELLDRSSHRAQHAEAER